MLLKNLKNQHSLAHTMPVGSGKNL